ncbi:TlpA family protein disulfide reductase [Spirillospora sp. NPDC048911]|uniref:TlpA family protein disulfide reductase n=1 Tax=Spirillospora sp. NPDC048911 TaxID=3364527 RepID=UPI00371EEB58
MAYLTAAVVLVGVLCVLNLTLTLAVIRRLREQGHGHAVSATPPVALKPGSRPAAFTATTTAGEQVSAADLTGLVGFFSAGCEPCHAMLPHFAERAGAMGRADVLAVIGGNDEELAAALAPVARVVVEDHDGPVAGAFQNSWTPAVYLLGPDHAVVATGGRLEDLPLGSAV